MKRIYEDNNPSIRRSIRNLFFNKATKEHVRSMSHYYDKEEFFRDYAKPVLGLNRKDMILIMQAGYNYYILGENNA